MDSEPDPYAPRASSSYVYPDSSRASSSYDGRSSGRPSSASPNSDGAEARSETRASSGSAEDADVEEPLFGGDETGGSKRHNGQDPAAGTEQGNRGSADNADNKDALYALLNVPREASEDQIREAYRALAVILHPDKHREPEHKSAAEAQFREVQRAYEILMDREKRSVYDYFGEEGLKTSWAVGLRGRTPQEMQAEFERQHRRKQQADAESLVKSKGDFTANIDMTSMFASADRIPRPRTRIGPVTLEDRWNRVGCTQLIGKHGFETQITNATAVNFSGQMVSRGGMGGGNLVGTVKTHWSPKFFSEITATLLRPQILTAKGQYTLDENTFFTFQSTSQTLAVPPAFNVTYGQRLSKETGLTGFTSFKSGTYTLGPWGKNLAGVAFLRRDRPNVAVGVTSQSGDGKGWTVQTSVGEADQSLSLDWGTKVLGGVKVRVGLNLGTGSGLSAFTNGERRVTENTRLGLGVTCGLPGGVTFRIRVNRLGQKIVLPILLSHEFRSDLVLLTTVLPAISMTAVHYLYLQPRKRRKIRDRLATLRQDNAEFIAQRRQAALEARTLLGEQVRKKASAEARKHGLVIVQAYYGKLDSFPNPPADADGALPSETLPSSAEDESVLEDAQAPWWDVQIPLQALVNQSQLIIPGGRAKSSLLGFFDPCMGERKHLRVRYLFRGRLHEAIVDDVTALAAPLRAHQL